MGEGELSRMKNTWDNLRGIAKAVFSLKEKKALFVVTLFFLFVAAFQHEVRATSFFEGDVWREPDRPFLFYGEREDAKNERLPKKEEKNSRKDAKESLTLANPFSGASPFEDTFATIEEIQKERKERLDRAILRPTEENIASYLAINAYLIEKASVFSSKWRDTLLKCPEFDWTARAPTVNAVSTKLTREKTRETARYLLSLKEDWGLVLFLDASKLSASMAPLARRFASLYGMELLEVAVDSRASGLFPKAKTTLGETRLIGREGLKLFPALVLLHRKDRSWSEARLVATGVVDVLEIGRRIERIVKEERGNSSFALNGKGEGAFNSEVAFQSRRGKETPETSQSVRTPVNGQENGEFP